MSAITELSTSLRSTSITPYFHLSIHITLCVPCVAHSSRHIYTRVALLAMVSALLFSSDSLPSRLRYFSNGFVRPISLPLSNNTFPFSLVSDFSFISPLLDISSLYFFFLTPYLSLICSPSTFSWICPLDVVFLVSP